MDVMEPYAKIIADSISDDGHRVTTMEVRFHRFVLAEFNTHRVFSRNSASSRAIPLKKQLERVTEGAARPVVWPAEQAGMQGGDELPGDKIDAAESIWSSASGVAASYARGLGQIGVHKSIANRLLEPFMWHTVVVTATAWENFFRQRCSPLAQPEIRVAAELMREAYLASTPVKLHEGSWHTPYVDMDVDQRWAASEIPVGCESFEDRRIFVWRLLTRISAARCARVSYLTQAGKRDPHEDLKLYDRLTSADPMHASPLEHVATPASWNQQHLVLVYDPILQRWIESPLPHHELRSDYESRVITLPKIGNFLGWRQLRLNVEMEKGWVSFS